MYRILFVDEQREDIDAFQDYVEADSLAGQIEVVWSYPEENLEDMISSVFELAPDAIVSDYQLNEIKTSISYNVPYTGVELVGAVLEKRHDFPCFVLTALDDEAVQRSEDVNIVYVKNILHEDGSNRISETTFLQRVTTQIDHYRARIQEAEGRLQELLELRRNGTAGLSDEEEMLRLDSMLEAATDKESAIPDQLKSSTNSDRLNELLGKVDQLLRKFN